MKCTVVIPTLNEEENIGRLVKKIFAVLGEKEVSIIVVDDNSSDRTQEIVRELATNHRNLHLLVRKNERGLGTAVRLGATHISDGPVVVMDADFSHDPSFIPPMLNILAKGFDVVVGSRYTCGGRIVGWTGFRIAISRVATMIARILLRVSLKDPMSGFAAFRSADILTQGIRNADYKFLLEVVATNRNLRVAEVPIVFRDRTRGKSKLGTRTLMLYLLLVFRLLFQRNKKGR